MSLALPLALGASAIGVLLLGASTGSTTPTPTGGGNGGGTGGGNGGNGAGTGPVIDVPPGLIQEFAAAWARGNAEPAAVDLGSFEDLRGRLQAAGLAREARMIQDLAERIQADRVRPPVPVPDGPVGPAPRPTTPQPAPTELPTDVPRPRPQQPAALRDHCILARGCRVLPIDTLSPNETTRWSPTYARDHAVSIPSGSQVHLYYGVPVTVRIDRGRDEDGNVVDHYIPSARGVTYHLIRFCYPPDTRGFIRCVEGWVHDSELGAAIG